MKKLLCLLIFSLAVFSCKKEPKADFSYTGSLLAGETIIFNNLSSNADSYLWDFGDGNTSTFEAPRYTYYKPGNYPVSLAATGNGKTATITKALKITGTTYSIKNNTSFILYSFASFYWDGTTITDFVLHGTLEIGRVTDPVRTERAQIQFGFSFAEGGELFLGVNPFILTQGIHNDFTINNTTQIYRGPDKSATFTNSKNLENMLRELKLLIRR